MSGVGRVSAESTTSSSSGGTARPSAENPSVKASETSNKAPALVLQLIHRSDPNGVKSFEDFFNKYKIPQKVLEHCGGIVPALFTDNDINTGQLKLVDFRNEFAFQPHTISFAHYHPRLHLGRNFLTKECLGLGDERDYKSIKSFLATHGFVDEVKFDDLPNIFKKAGWNVAKPEEEKNIYRWELRKQEKLLNELGFYLLDNDRLVFTGIGNYIFFCHFRITTILRRTI